MICVDNLITGAADNIAHMAGHDRFKFIKHDITNDLFLPGKIDGVLHLPARLAPGLPGISHSDAQGRLSGNHKALGLAKAKGARFLLASTSEVYGDPQSSSPAGRLLGPCQPGGAPGVYDEAKRFAEAMAMAYHRTTG